VNAVDPLPLVSVVIPALNEARHIGDSLNALRNQSYPAERLEILVADGRSADETRAVVSRLAAEDPRIRLLDSPTGRTAEALNTAIRAAAGSVICRMDAHAVPADDYIEQCVSTLVGSGASCVGGRMENVGSTPMAAAIAAAATSRFGIGDSAFHYARAPEAVESVYLGCWWRSVFDEVGMFNPELIRNQDDELSYRIRQSGGVVWFDPRIRVRYYGRETLSGLFRQYRQYGYWKIRVFQMHPGAIRWRHLVPGGLIATVVGSTLSAPFLPVARLILAGTVMIYAVAAFLAADSLARRAPGLQRIRIAAAFGAMHVGYGSGLWSGLVALITSPPKHPHVEPRGG
jgi:succinoglycan biosynthesis protein ExoA